MRQSSTTQSGQVAEASRSPLRRFLTRRTGLIPFVFIVPAAGVLFAVRANGSSPSWKEIVAMIVIGAAALLAVVRLAAMLSGVDTDVHDLAEHLATDTGQQRLLARWLSRARWARNIGGLAGIVAWLLGTNGKGDLLLCGLGGIAIGAMVAELHHIRPARGPRVATLQVRKVDDYLLATDKRRMIAIAVVAVALAVAGLFANDSGNASWWALAAIIVLGLAHLVQQRVATRPQPVLSATLKAADDLARELSIGRGLARPAAFFSLAMLAVAAGDLSEAFGGFALLQGATWIYALYLWWHNRRLGLDFMLRGHGPVLA